MADLDLPAEVTRLRALLAGDLTLARVGSGAELDEDGDLSSWMLSGTADGGIWWLVGGDEDDFRPMAEFQSDGARLTGVSVPMAVLAGLLDATEERTQLLAALAEQEKEFVARSLHPQGLDEGVRQGMGRVITALRNAADGGGDDA